MNIESSNTFLHDNSDDQASLLKLKYLSDFRPSIWKQETQKPY